MDIVLEWRRDLVPMLHDNLLLLSNIQPGAYITPSGKRFKAGHFAVLSPLIPFEVARKGTMAAKTHVLTAF
jgi:hypothetical protein